MGFLCLRGISWQIQIEKYQREFKFLIWRWRFVLISLEFIGTKRTNSEILENACYGDLICKHPMRICQSLNFLENEFHQTWTLHFLKLGQSEWLSKNLLAVFFTPFSTMKILSLNCRGIGIPKAVEELRYLVREKVPKIFSSLKLA